MSKSERNHELLDACRNGHTNRVEGLIKAEANVDFSNDGTTPVHEAVRNFCLQCLKTLVECGAQIDPLDKNYESPLYSAVLRNNYPAAEYLLGKGAKVDAKDLKYPPMLFLAASKGNAAMAELLIIHGADMNDRDVHGRTPLLHALTHGESGAGHEAVTRLLLEQHADPYAQDGYGMTAMHMAVRWGLEEIAEVIIEFYDQEAEEPRTKKWEKTPLHLATTKGRVGMVAWLLRKGWDPDKEQVEQKTALHLAVERNQEDIVKALLEQSLTLDKTDSYGSNALHYAATLGRVRILDMILGKESSKDFVDSKNDEGRTALRLAVRKGRTECVKSLLEAGADKHTVDDITELTAKEAAAQFGDPMMLKLFD